MADTPAVAIRDLYFAYDDAPVVEAAHVTIEPLDFVGIVGPNGGGKTTLLKLMLGLLEPVRGTVRVFGERPERARRRVGYVPQSFQYDPQFPSTLTDVVLMGRLGKAAFFGPYRGADRNAAARALHEVGLSDLGDRPFGAVSGGQRQRALIARALASGADMLMLDEPTAHVDSAAESEVYSLLRDLNRAMTIIVVTHDLSFVSKFVKNVLCVNRRVATHPTCDIDDVTGDLLKQTYGPDWKMVRHDQHCEEGDPECSTSGAP